MVVDTGIFIEFLRKKDKSQTTLFRVSEQFPLAISVITLYEMLMGATNQQKRKDIELLTSDLLILELDESSIKIAA